jgi:hypothetical protein
MADFEQMLQEFKSFGELQAFSESQHKTINELTKKIVSLENETIELKRLLEGTVPLFGTERLVITNEEMICLKQIEEMRRISDIQILTLDQTRQLDILVKNLHSIRTNSKKDLPGDYKHLDETKLLELAK